MPFVPQPGPGSAHFTFVQEAGAASVSGATAIAAAPHQWVMEPIDDGLHPHGHFSYTEIVIPDSFGPAAAPQGHAFDVGLVIAVLVGAILVVAVRLSIRLAPLFFLL